MTDPPIMQVGPEFSASSSGDQRDRSFRAYSKKFRVFVFREFVLSKYAYSADNTNSYLQPNDVILDVAGGKGDLSWLLTNVDQYRSVVVDPRMSADRMAKTVEFLQRHPEECAIRAIPDRHTYQPLAALMPKLLSSTTNTNTNMNFNQWQSPERLRIFLDKELVEVIQKVLVRRNSTSSSSSSSDESVRSINGEWKDYWSRATRRTAGFVTPTGKREATANGDNDCGSIRTITNPEQALQVILRAKLIVGFHPDQATDYCIQLAQILHIPVCIVPCCVFPSEFPHRKINFRTKDAATGQVIQTDRPVEHYDDLIQYCQDHMQNPQIDELAFSGTKTARSTVLWTLPPNRKA